MHRSNHACAVCVRITALEWLLVDLLLYMQGELWIIRFVLVERTSSKGWSFSFNHWHQL